MKKCTGCKKTKQLSEFRKDSRRKDKATAKCKQCLSIKEKTKYQQSNRRISIRNNQLLKTYGISFDDYVCLFEFQNGCCSICRTPLILLGDSNTQYKTACVDHNHKTGYIRSLLCNSCNRGIGLFKDNAVLLRLAAEYLEKDSIDE